MKQTWQEKYCSPMRIYTGWCLVVGFGASLCVRLNLEPYGMQTNMACLIKKYSKCEVRVVIRFLQDEGV